MSLSRHPVFPLALQPCVSRLVLDPTQHLFRAGTPPRYIHFVEEGAVRLVRHGRQGEEVVLHDARPGEFLAEASLDSLRYHCDAVASQPSVALRAAKADFQRLLADDPDFARSWMALLAAQLRTERARVERRCVAQRRRTRPAPAALRGPGLALRTGDHGLAQGPRAQAGPDARIAVPDTCQDAEGQGHCPRGAAAEPGERR